MRPSLTAQGPMRARSRDDEKRSALSRGLDSSTVLQMLVMRLDVHRQIHSLGMLALTKLAPAA